MLPDLTVLHTARDGIIRHTDPATGVTNVITDVPVYNNSEDGLQNLALDPDFENNGWVYLFYAPATMVNAEGENYPESTPEGSAPTVLPAGLDDGADASVVYQVDGGAWTEFTGPFEVTEPGDYTVGYRQTDEAGDTTSIGAIEFSVVAGEVEPEPAAFVDVPEGMLFFEDIQWLFENGISTGWEAEDGREYRPLTPIARDAMAAFLYRQANSPEFTEPAVSPFTDVSTDNQFYKEIAWLHAEEISTGWANGDGTFSFRPYEPINRDAMAAFLYRMADEPEFTAPTTSPFTDITPATQFYAEITWLVSEGISTGWLGNDGTAIYRPTVPINRDAMAAFLHRYDDAGFSNVGD